MKDVPGFEGRYAVTSDGRVFSHGAGVFLRPGRMPSGHLSVCLGRGNSRCVHELVLLTFVGPPPEGHEARHLNGNPADNRLLNLQWATRRRNCQDKKWHNGAKNYKLSVPQVREIKAAATLSSRALAKRFGVCKTTITNIRSGLSHADV